MAQAEGQMRAAERVQEDRGPVVTVVEEFAEPAAVSPAIHPDGAPSADGFRAPSHSAKVSGVEPAPRTPVLLRRTTITQGPVRTVVVAKQTETETATTVATVKTETTSTVKPSAGCAFGLGALVPILIALVAIVIVPGGVAFIIHKLRGG